MGVPLERAWAICRLLDEADAERSDQDIERAFFLTEPAEVLPMAVPASMPIPRPRPVKQQPAKTPTKAVAKKVPPVPRPVPRPVADRIDPDAAERLRARRRKRLGLG